MPHRRLLPPRQRHVLLRVLWVGGLVTCSSWASGQTVGADKPLPRAEMPVDPPEPGASGPAPDVVVGSIDGHQIHLGDLIRASRGLPESLRALPFDVLMPILLDRFIDHQALVIMARRAKLEDDPAVRREIDAAAETVLEGAYLSREAAPRVTEPMILAQYNRQFGGKPAVEEVRARHILVPTEAEARKIIEELRAGGDFAALAKRLSQDLDAARGGDLGFFRRDQVWPAFADIAFALHAGEVGSYPVKNEFGWHAVKVEERRLVPPPSYAEARETLRRGLLAEVIQETAARARAGMAVRRFNLDGSDMDTPFNDVILPVLPR